MMAVRLRVPVVPVRIRGLFEVYSVHDAWPRRGPVEVVVGKPMTFPANTPYEAAAQALAVEIGKL